MKRVRDDDNSNIGPMFPRLHVNDTAEKGGPRAPPRNKMALYEQLSIPSHTFANKPGLPSSSQGSGVDRNVAIKRRLPSSTTTTPWSDKFLDHHPDETNSTGFQSEQSKKVRDEDDFTVPVFVQPRVGKIQSGAGNIRDTVSSISISSSISGRHEEQRNHGVKPAHKSGRGNDSPAKEAGESLDRSCLSNFSRLHQEARIEAPVDVSRRSDDLIQSTRCYPRSEYDCGEGYGGLNQFEGADKADDVSETSMMDSASRVGITPDDTVGVIGQKNFWNARKTIVNQQRVFAVQVFELHRLIKVQRLIAGSPNIFFEEGDFVEKPSTDDSPVEELQTEFVAKPLPVVSSCKEDSEKPSHKECSTLSTIETDHYSEKNGSQSLNYELYMGKQQQQVGTPNDNKTNPWYFPQPPGPQWLVPVMTPSEGLVYKPYAGHGATGAVYGGYGPFGPIPMMGNYPSSAYGAPASHPVGPLYFPPPYGMPVPAPTMSGSTVEQASQVAGPSVQSQTGLSVVGGGAKANAKQQSSCTEPSQKNGSIISQAKMFRASRKSDLQQGSTASSRHEMFKDVRDDQSAQRKDLSFHSLSPEATQRPLALRSDVAKPTRAIKAVPHNPRSATESAARIFRFIQEERKLYDVI